MSFYFVSLIMCLMTQTPGYFFFRCNPSRKLRANLEAPMRAGTMASPKPKTMEDKLDPIKIHSMTVVSVTAAMPILAPLRPNITRGF